MSGTQDTRTPLDSHACWICGRTDDDKPQCFKGEGYCCDSHRKAILVILEHREEEKEVYDEN